MAVGEYETIPADQRIGLIQVMTSEIRAFCVSHADSRIVAKYARYFTEGYDAYGVPGDILHGKSKEWLESYRKSLGLEGFLDLGDSLWKDGKYEEGNLAVYFVMSLSEEFQPETLDRLGRWFDIGVRNWAHSDVLCGDLLGQFLSRRIVALDAFGSWRESDFKYKRRAVPVTMLALLKPPKSAGADGIDYNALLDFIRRLMLDGERAVQQGLGWFLREARKRQPEPVEIFLLEWKDTAPRLIFQYATEKMTSENKARFRRERQA